MYSGQSYMSPPPAKWLQEAADGQLIVDGENLWKVLRHRAYVQVLNEKGEVISPPFKIRDAVKFRVTERGMKYLENLKTVKLPFNRESLPNEMKLWVSGLKRWARNCPKGLVLAYEDGSLRVLAKDTDDKVTLDEAHELLAVSVPWHVVKKT